MNIQSIKYLSALAKYQHFGKAAKACFVSQPTLSMQIKKLEDRLGVQLLERTNKSVKLTPAGMQIAEHAKTILCEIDAIREYAEATKDPYSGQLKIGIIPTAAPYLLPLIIPKLAKTFPKLTLNWQEAQTHILLEELKEGKLDTVILALPIVGPQFMTCEFFKEKFLLATSPHHSLAKRKTVKPSDLHKQKLLLLDDGHCLRDQALAFCQFVQAQEAKELRATSLETIRHMVVADLGVTLMPQLACRKDDGLSYLNFTEPKPSRSLSLTWRKSTGRSQLFSNLANTLRKIMT